MPLRLRYVAVACALGALALACTDETDGLGNSETLDPPPACPDAALKAVTLRQVSSDVAEVQIGACGHIAYESAGGIELLSPDLSGSVRLAEMGSRPVFGAGGLKLLYQGQGRLHLRDLLDDSEETVEVFQPSYGFVVARNRSGIPWWCAKGVLQAWGEEPMEARTCPSHSASAGPSVLWLDASGVGMANLERGRITHPSSDARYISQQRHDDLVLSADGELFGYQRINVRPCDDTFCATPEGLTHFLTPEGNEVGSLPANITGRLSNGLKEPKSGHSMITGSDAGVHWIDEDFTIHTRANYRIGYLANNGERALLFRVTGDTSTLVWQERSSGDDTVLINDLQGPRIRNVSLDERSVAVAHTGDSCIAYPDRPDVCHTQVWKAHVFSGDSVAVYPATQPVEVQWVGNDGSALVSGRLLDKPVPDVAEPSLGSLRSCLFDADENEEVCWDSGEIQQVEELANGLLIVVRRIRGLDVTVEVVDRGFRRKSVLLESASGARLFVGPRRQRLAIMTQIHNVRVPDQLWIASASGLLDP